MSNFWGRFPKGLTNHWSYRRNHALTMVLLDECSRVCEATFSMRDLAERLKISVSTVSRFLKEGLKRGDWTFGYDKVRKVCWFKFVGGIFRNLWASKKNKKLEQVQQFRKGNEALETAFKEVSRAESESSATVRIDESATVVQQFVQQSEELSSFDKTYLNAGLQKLKPASATVPATQIYSLDNLDTTTTKIQNHLMSLFKTTANAMGFQRSNGRLSYDEIQWQKAEALRRYGGSAGQMALAP